MNIETLYLSDSFNDYLLTLSIKRRIKERDDFVQNVFLELVSIKEIWSVTSAKKIADKVAQRAKRKQIRDDCFSIIENIDGSTEAGVSVLWEDNHILR
jgi:hypothetical protein